jgi:hexosaminidase
VVLDAQGDTPVHYTLDGSEPNSESPLYTTPVEIREDCTVKAVSYRKGEPTKTYKKSFYGHKAMGRHAEALTETHPSYRYTCPALLTDGLRGAGPYNSGDFAGWYNQPMEAVIDMGGASYDSVTLCTFVFKYDYIFPPTDLTVYISEEGEHFTEVAHVEYPLDGRADDGNGCQEYTVTFPETTARFLKVHAGCIPALPEWHSGAGRPGFVFVDEIVVK